MADEKRDQKPPLPRRAWSEEEDEAAAYRAVKERLESMAPDPGFVVLYGGPPEREPRMPELSRGSGAPVPAYGGPPIRRRPLLVPAAGALLGAGAAYAVTGSAGIAVLGLVAGGAVPLLVGRMLR